jgi:hypothetical protein
LATGQYSTGGNDCKHYSLFQAGILDSLKRKGKNIDWCYRFANYKLFSTTPHHVFVVVKINGKDYWCDPVLNYWDQKKPYINKIDKKMSLYSISGIGRTRRHRHIAAKIALFPGRKAFLALVRINLDKFAIKLYRRLHSSSRSALLHKWEQLGGKPALLESTVNKAVAKYNRRHPNRRIGAIDPATQGIIAAATPIIVALLAFLKPQRKDEITQDASAAKEAVDMYQSQQSSADQSQDQSADQSQDQSTLHGTMDPYLLYGGLALAGYFIYKNKKKLFR